MISRPSLPDTKERENKKKEEDEEEKTRQARKKERKKDKEGLVLSVGRSLNIKKGLCCCRYKGKEGKREREARREKEEVEKSRPGLDEKGVELNRTGEENADGLL